MFLTCVACEALLEPHRDASSIEGFSGSWYSLLSARDLPGRASFSVKQVANDTSLLLHYLQDIHKLYRMNTDAWKSVQRVYAMPWQGRNQG